MTRSRLTDAKIKRAIALAKEHGVRITLTPDGGFVVDPANDAADRSQADEVQRKIEAMGRR